MNFKTISIGATLTAIVLSVCVGAVVVKNSTQSSQDAKFAGMQAKIKDIKIDTIRLTAITYAQGSLIEAGLTSSAQRVPEVAQSLTVDTIKEYQKTGAEMCVSLKNDNVVLTQEAKMAAIRVKANERAAELSEFRDENTPITSTLGAAVLYQAAELGCPDRFSK